MGARTRAELVESVDAPGVRPGAFEYYREGDRDPAGMVYVCPCGCGQQGDLSFCPSARAHAWTWDGNREEPTLDPSVHHQIRGTGGRTTTHWHGWLRRGWWESV